MQYFVSVVNATRSSPLGNRDIRELKTLAAGLDLLARGKVSQLGDLLIQRFKSVESTCSQKDPTPREVAERLELIPSEELTSAGQGETAMAAQLQLRKEKLKEKFQGKLRDR